MNAFQDEKGPLKIENKTKSINYHELNVLDKLITKDTMHSLKLVNDLQKNEAKTKEDDHEATPVTIATIKGGNKNLREKI